VPLSIPRSTKMKRSVTGVDEPETTKGDTVSSTDAKPEIKPKTQKPKQAKKKGKTSDSSSEDDDVNYDDCPGCCQPYRTLDNGENTFYSKDTAGLEQRRIRNVERAKQPDSKFYVCSYGTVHRFEDHQSDREEDDSESSSDEESDDGYNHSETGKRLEININSPLCPFSCNSCDCGYYACVVDDNGTRSKVLATKCECEEPCDDCVCGGCGERKLSGEHC
jgi:hypothetical protein